MMFIRMFFGRISQMKTVRGASFWYILSHFRDKYACLFMYTCITLFQNDFDYAGQQKLLFDYHNAFQKVDRIVKKEDGTLPHFWLSLMRNWLKGIIFIT